MKKMVHEFIVINMYKLNAEIDERQIPEGTALIHAIYSFAVRGYVYSSRIASNWGSSRHLLVLLITAATSSAILTVNIVKYGYKSGSY